MNVQNPSASRGIVIQAVDLVKNYGTGSNMVHALRGVNVSFERGKFTAIMGPSGSGKSTLMHTLAGLDSATSGHILFGGADLTRMDDKQLTLLRRHKIGFIFQSFNLLPMFTAEQNILMPLTLAGDKPDRAWFDLLVETLGLKQRLNHRPNELSGGQQQRVAIARALAMDPICMLFDEPTSALDPATTESILTLIKDINRRLGITAVIITHEMSVIEKICNQVAIISHGRIAESGSVEEVFFHPRTEEARQLVIPEAMQPERMPHERLYRIIFNGRSSFEPVIGNLVLECGVPVNIMYADTRDIGGTAFGQMVLQLPDDEAVVRRILAFAESKGLMLEEMNHV